MTTTGDFIGSYRVLGLLGSGGMGEVYRAHDTKLGRDVAIKVLPASVAADADRRTRFEREARLLAALHHPNIAQIFGLEGQDGRGGQVPSPLAIVMELVEGPTLAECLEHGPLGTKQVVAIARQIADALDAAHEKGIVHRDLKPTNIKVMVDGTVKVLDFGLATAVQGGPAADADATRPVLSLAGEVRGTPAYMSPEQARGQAIDKRTDIWAFGVVLYEMLAGRPPFTGATASDIMANLLQHEPDLDALPPSTPRSVRRLIARCLEKDPKRRMRDIGDVRSDLEAQQAPQTSSRRAESPAPLAGVWIAAIVLAAVTTGVAVWRLKPAPTVSSPADPPEALTNDPGYAGEATLSPDGRLLAYTSDRTGRGDMDIWVQQVGGGAPLRVTDDENDDRWPDFSPDGNQIVFRSERNGGGVYVVPSLGGGVRLVAPGGRNPRFSPDGTQIAYWTGQIRGELSGRLSEVHVVSLNGGVSARLMADFEVAAVPIWSPDGKGLLVQGLRNRQQAEIYDWWYAPVSGAAPTRTGIMDLPSLRKEANRQNIVFSGPWTRSGFLISVGARVMMLPLAPLDGRLTGEPEILTYGVGAYGTPAISQSGDVIVSSFAQVRTIDRLPLGAASEAPTEHMRDSNNVGWRASTTRDGSLIVFERVSGGRREIWSKNVGSGEQRMLLPVGTSPPVNATVSDDGARFTYVIPDNGNPDFGKGFTLEIAGGVPRAVCEGCSLWGFMPDSRRVIVTDTKSVRLIDPTGAPRAIVTSASRLDRPSVSPDGRSLAFRIAHGQDVRTFVVPIPQTGSVQESQWIAIDEPTTTGRPCGWSPDSSTLYLLLDTDGYRDVWGQKIDGSSRPIGKPFVVRHLHHTTGVSTSFGNAVTSQGLLYEATRVTSNLWRLTAGPGK